MVQILQSDDCPPEPIEGWVLGVLGYGNQGRAQALNLRDSGHAVVVGADPAWRGAQRASAEGFPVVPLGRLAREADLVAVLLPDHVQREAVSELAREGGRSGRIRALVFAHGFSLRFDPPPLLPAWDVVLIAPAGPGVQLRSRYAEGGGLPALLAVHRDASGAAEGVARAYGSAIGCARAGLIRTTVAAETEIDLFGEQVVLCGGMNALLRCAFEVLTGAGYPPEMAYLECVQQLKLTAELVERFGVDGMRRRISPTALYGDLSRGPRLIDPDVRHRMVRVLEEIRSGEFAQEWLQKIGSDPEWPEADLGRARNPEMEDAGEMIRGLYGGSSGAGSADPPENRSARASEKSGSAGPSERTSNGEEPGGKGVDSPPGLS